MKKSTFGDLDEEMDEKDEHESKHALHKHQVMFKPSRGEWFVRLTLGFNRTDFPTDVTHAIFYRGHWLKVGTRSQYSVNRLY